MNYVWKLSLHRRFSSSGGKLLSKSKFRGIVECFNSLYHTSFIREWRASNYINLVCYTVDIPTTIAAF